MKFILLLLFPAILFSQENFPDYTRVIAYRLIEEYNDGPCNVLSYIKEGQVGRCVQSIESYSPELAYKLHKIKQQSKSWQGTKHSCGKRLIIGAETIHNMFVVEINRVYDTIYTTEDNLNIFDYEKSYVYADAKHVLLNTLPVDFKAFFKEDFRRKRWDKVKLDTLAPEKVIYNNKVLYSTTYSDFNRNFDEISSVKIDSIIDDNDYTVKSYWATHSELEFYQKTKLLKSLAEKATDYIEEPYLLHVDGIGINDKEDTLLKKFPLSTQYKGYNLPGYSIDDTKDDYCYEVLLADGKGSVFFHVRKRKIYKIEVNFDR